VCARPHAEPIAKAVHLSGDEIVITPNGKRDSSARFSGASGLPGNKDGMILFLIDPPVISASLVHELIERFLATNQTDRTSVYEGNAVIR